MSDNTSPEKSPWGWKALIIATILSIIFLVVFYLAMQHEPDYMPGKQREARAAQASSAPVEHQMDMSAEEHNMTAEEHNMTAEEHAAMTDSSASTAHHGH